VTRLSRRPVFYLFVAALLAAIGFPLWFELGHPGDHYGGPDLWPGLVGNFTASFFAFVLALAWDREQRREEWAQEQSLRADEIDRAATEEQGRRKTDARRLLEVVVDELRHNRDQIAQFAASSVGNAPFAYHLRLGGWERSADNLGRLLSKSDLVAKTSSLYDRLGELRWRLRFMVEAGMTGTAAIPTQSAKRTELKDVIDSSDLLARSIDQDLGEILKLLVDEAEDPAVDLLGIRREIVASDSFRVTDAAIVGTSSIGSSP
jgi:hypothetical protein